MGLLAHLPKLKAQKYKERDKKLKTIEIPELQRGVLGLLLNKNFKLLLRLAVMFCPSWLRKEKKKEKEIKGKENERK